MIGTQRSFGTREIKILGKLILSVGYFFFVKSSASALYKPKLTLRAPEA